MKKLCSKFGLIRVLHFHFDDYFISSILQISCFPSHQREQCLGELTPDYTDQPVQARVTEVSFYSDNDNTSLVLWHDQVAIGLLRRPLETTSTNLEHFFLLIRHRYFKFRLTSETVSLISLSAVKFFHSRIFTYLDNPWNGCTVGL